MPKPSGNRAHDEGVQVSLDVLARLGCPDVRPGEGSDLFGDSVSIPTPDLVAGPFNGPTHPETFFIDVLCPSGEYTLDAKAKGGRTPAFLLDAIKKRGTFSIDDVPLDFAAPLNAAIEKKIAKYAASRSGSRLFGLVAYFDDRIKYAGQPFTSLLFWRALNQRFPVPSGPLLETLLLGDGAKPTFFAEVGWQLPISFLMYLRRQEQGTTRQAILVNKSRPPDAGSSHTVIGWLDASLATGLLGHG